MSKAKINKNVDEMLSDSDSSVQVKTKKQVPVKGKAKPQKNSDDSSSEEEIKLLKTKKERANSGDKNNKNKKMAVESDSESDVKPKKPVAKAPAKKKADSDDESSEVPAKKPVAKAPAKKQADSDDESSEVPAKKPVAKAPAKKQADSDDESSEVVPAKKTEVVPAKTFNAQASTSDCNELFVKNLSWGTDEDKLYNHFSKYGTVENVKVLYDKMTGKARGLAFVQFSSRAEAETAMNGSNEVDGRTLQTSFSDQKDAGKAPYQNGGRQNGNQNGGGFQKSNYEGERYTIFVGNLGFKTNENTVKNFFKDCGGVVDVRIAQDRDTGRSKGFCHVDFDSSDAVEKAKLKAGEQLDGREVRVDASIPKQGGGSQRGGRGGRGGFRGGRGGNFNPLDRAKKSGGIIQPSGKTVTTFDEDDE